MEKTHKPEDAAFKEYWLSGTPSRLVTETRRGLGQIASMLAVLASELQPDGAVPSAWGKLPKISVLEKAGRARCTGISCPATRIYRDTPDELWLTHVAGIWVSGPLPPEVGSTMVSVDANAALWDTNVSGLIWGY